jgi:hypothetical protein
MEQQKPTIGRIVHYVSHGTPIREDGTQAFKAAPRAAIITGLREHGGPVVDLCVLNPTGMFFNQDVPFDGAAEPEGGTWHWPPRA